MKYLTGYFFKRLPREGYKSLSAPALAFALVFLINLLGAIQAWQRAEYNDLLDNYPIFAELSDLSGSTVDMLFIGEKYINLLTDPSEEFFPLSGYVDSLLLKRALDITSVSGKSVAMALTGITDSRADDTLNGAGGAHLSFYDGYDESIFKSGEPACLVSDDLTELAEAGVLHISARAKLRYQEVKVPQYQMIREGVGRLIGEEIVTMPIEAKDVETTLTVVGAVIGAGSGVAFCPFEVASELGTESDGMEPYTDRMAATLADNRYLLDFKQAAWRHFPKVRPVYDSRPFAMTIYDSLYYDEIVPLMQNIILIDTATPVVYAVSACVSIIASNLLTRRRKQDFAIMRSVGVSKPDIFLSVLFEQAALCFVGALWGAAMVSLIWGYTSFERPAVFLALYIIGAALPAVRATGANVLKILRDKE